MQRTTLRLTAALVLASTALSLVPLAAAQPNPGPLVGEAIGTATDTARYALDVAVGAGDTVLDAIDGLAPTVVGLITSLFTRVMEVVGQVREINDEVIQPILDNILCIVQDLVTRCD